MENKDVFAYIIRIDVDNQYADILLTEYSAWFSKYENQAYRVLFQFERKSNLPTDLFDYYELKNAETIGDNKEKKELIIKENDCIYMNTHLFHNETVYMSLNLSSLRININYFTALTIDDLMALIKTAFIWANNYLLKLFVFLIHASAVEVKNNCSVIFIGVSGAGKTTVSKYCRDDGCLVLSDETILLWKENGNYYVQGTPWHGSEKTIIGSAKICSLNCVYILNKHQQDYYEKSINKYENKCALLNQWLNCAQFNIDKFIQGTKFVADLINDIEIYKLFFTKSNRFITVIKNQGVRS
ncbi:MAG: hypothetical protein EWM47_00150 [Anaerolineaceae bacterium]|nr:MAG: hypothetical protein EWM47_00150 [Anaerolineaceae bacterium]